MIWKYAQADFSKVRSLIMITLTGTWYLLVMSVSLLFGLMYLWYSRN